MPVGYLLAACPFYTLLDLKTMLRCMIAAGFTRWYSIGRLKRHGVEWLIAISHLQMLKQKTDGHGFTKRYCFLVYKLFVTQAALSSPHFIAFTCHCDLNKLSKLLKLYLCYAA